MAKTKTAMEKAAETRGTTTAQALPPEPACQDCRFALRLANEADLRCRRFPPASPNGLGYGPPQHPIVLPFDWCGEFRLPVGGRQWSQSRSEL